MKLGIEKPPARTVGGSFAIFGVYQGSFFWANQFESNGISFGTRIIQYEYRIFGVVLRAIPLRDLVKIDFHRSTPF